MNTKGIHKPKPEDPIEGFPGETRENPFRVPEGYFREFSSRLEQAIEKDSRPVARIDRRTWLVAASLALLVAVGSILIYRQQQAPATELLPVMMVSVQDLDDNGILDRIDEFTLVEMFPENNIELLEEDINSTTEAISNEEIEEYLIQSNEIESLIQNL